MTQGTVGREAVDADGRVLPGTGRLGVIRSYFAIYAAIGVVVTGGTVAAVLWPSLGVKVFPANHPLLAIGAAGMFTWGAIQTGRMLRQRRRVGAWAAAVTFAASVAAAGSPAGALATVVVNSVGLVLLISVWRHLDP